jgi:hypothetical protein
MVLIISPAPSALSHSLVSMTTSASSSSAPSFLLSSAYPYSLNGSNLPSSSLHLYPSPSTTGYAQHFIDTVYEIYSMVALALNEEQMTLYALHHVPKPGTTAVASVKTSPFTPLDSLVDPFHVRELYDTYFKELEDNVHLMSTSLLESIEQIEKQCARLMTLLRPIYDRCRLPLPSPPSKSTDISHFLDPITSLPSSAPSSSLPLTFSSSSSVAAKSIECTLEMSRLIILRARRLWKQQIASSPSASEGSLALSQSSLSAYQVEITNVLRFIYHDIVTTIRRYQEILTTHRTQLIQDRTNAIDIYKTNLILNLKNRHIDPSIGTAGATAGGGGGATAGGAGGAPEDLQIFKQFSEKFRVITTAEPYLYDVKVCYSAIPLQSSSASASALASSSSVIPRLVPLSVTSTGIPIFPSPPTTGAIQSSNNRNGVLYLTYSHLYFTSYDLFLLSSIQRIIPIDSIHRIGIIRATLLASDAISIELETQPQQQQQNENNSHSHSHSSGSHGSSSVLTEQIVFYVSSSTVFYVDRVIDLILWIKEIRKKDRNGHGQRQEEAQESQEEISSTPSPSSSLLLKDPNDSSGVASSPSSSSASPATATSSVETGGLDLSSSGTTAQLIEKKGLTSSSFLLSSSLSVPRPPDLPQDLLIWRKDPIPPPHLWWRGIATTTKPKGFR